MRATARAIIIQNNKVLLIHRFKEEREYYVIPGGGIEPNETAEQAVKREIEEELSLSVIIDKKIGEYLNDNNLVTYYLVRTFRGEVALDGPEKIKMQEDPTNRYIHEWINIDILDSINLVPEFVKNVIDEVSSKIV